MTENPFVLNYGSPCNWICPDCRVLFVLYPGLPFDKENHNCAAKRRAGPRICPCWWRLIDDHRVESFVVDGLPFPEEMTVETLSPTGEPQFWERRQEGGLDVFYPPKCYRDAEFFKAALDLERGCVMRPGPRQKLQLVSRPQLEKLALRNRHSVDLGAA